MASSNNNNNNINSKTPNGDHPRNRWKCMQPRACPYCFKTFSNSFNLKQHTINVHIESQGVACTKCDKVVKNKWYLRKHLVTAHGAPLKRAKDGTHLGKDTSAAGGEDGDEMIVVDDDEPPVAKAKAGGRK